ncbi:MAG: TIGR02710 family CRISPR-associated CARF protein [bacterium]
MNYMFITVGTGRNREDIANAILKSIEIHNPDKVIFFCTYKSKEETIPFIERKFKDFEIVVFEDENDLELIKQRCDEEIRKIKREKESYIIVDYTSGTKAMSAGIILSAIENEVNNISYIAGRRDDSGRVIPGNERVISFSPTQIYARKLYLEGIKYFNERLFESAKKLFETVIETYEEDSIREKASLLIKLCDAYLSWDLFNHSKAFEILKGLSKEEMTLITNWEIKSRIEGHKELLYKINKEQFSIEKALDLLKNAERRLLDGKYDDCVARLYRLIEYVLQFILAERNLYVKSNDKFDTSRIDLSKIPEYLRNEYSKPCGLEASAKLLKELNDEIGIEICDDEEVKKLLSVRNSSILAHGFKPIEGETAEKFFNLLKKFVQKLGSFNLEDIYRKFDFPQIKVTVA